MLILDPKAVPLKLITTPNVKKHIGVTTFENYVLSVRARRMRATGGTLRVAFAQLVDGVHLAIGAARELICEARRRCAGT